MNGLSYPLLIMCCSFWLGAMFVGGLIAAHYRVSGLHRNGLLEQENLGPALRRYLDNPRRFQITTGTLFLMLSLLGGFALGKLLLFFRDGVGGPGFFGIFLLVILVVWSFGGVVFRMMATAAAVSYARVVGTILYPVVWLLGPWASLLLAAMDRVDDTIWSGDMQQHLSAGEIRELISGDADQSALDEDEREMIQSIFEFHDTAVREIMIPRIDMVTLDGDAEVEKMVDAVNESGHSRIPVYRGNVDKVIGILYSKDLLKLIQEGQFETGGQKLADMVRPAYFIPESKKIDEVLDEFRSQRIHMAVVIDEYGGTAGLVTLEDVIEEIVGEIEDEFDEEEELVTWVDDTSVRLDPKLSLDDLEELVGVDLNNAEGAETSETLGGLIYEAAGKVPSRGDRVEIANFVVTVEGVSGQRITRVLFVSPNPLAGFNRQKET
jgi:magnesium and cobalt exporter, CNNM family